MFKLSKRRHNTDAVFSKMLRRARAHRYYEHHKEKIKAKRREKYSIFGE